MVFPARTPNARWNGSGPASCDRTAFGASVTVCPSAWNQSNAVIRRVEREQVDVAVGVGVPAGHRAHDAAGVHRTRAHEAGARRVVDRDLPSLAEARDLDGAEREIVTPVSIDVAGGDRALQGSSRSRNTEW